MFIFTLLPVLCGLACLALATASYASPPPVTISGDWHVRVSAGEVRVAGKTVTVSPLTFAVTPAVMVTVRAERYDSLPIFDPGAAEWARGARLRGVTTQETTAKGYLDPASVVVASAPDGGTIFAAGTDYTLDPAWGTLGRLAGGRIGAQQPVYISYRHGMGRLDSIIITGKGHVVLREGVPSINTPRPPALARGEKALANIWVSGRLARLTADQLFPVRETAYPEHDKPTPTEAEQLLPKTLKKLRAGERVKILAWGDSVTDGSFLPAPETERWQAQFLARLRAAYPAAQIELVSLGWGGRNTDSFLHEPAGSPYNYAEQVLGAKPDLIVSEFVNDAWMSPAEVETHYSKFLADFQHIGAEWIILTPHYVRPDWMSLTRERDIDTDPRPYVAGLRQFAARHAVALADASLRWGRLWRQGLPYTTLLLNAINHPDARGMKLFADSLLALFP